MTLTVDIPDEIAGRLSAWGGGDLSRRAREAFLAEEYRHEFLSIETSYQFDGFLGAHDTGSSIRRSTPSATARSWDKPENAPGRI